MNLFIIMEKIVDEGNYEIAWVARTMNKGKMIGKKEENLAIIQSAEFAKKKSNIIFIIMLKVIYAFILLHWTHQKQTVGGNFNFWRWIFFFE